MSYGMKMGCGCGHGGPGRQGRGPDGAFGRGFPLGGGFGDGRGACRDGQPGGGDDALCDDALADRRRGRRCGGRDGGHGGGHGGARGGDGFGDAFGGFGGGFGGGRGGRGGGRRRLFDNGELRLLLLHLIAQEPHHGYDLIRALEGLSGGAYVPSPGMIYPALTMMAEMEQIAEQPGEGARKVYALAPEGEAYLAAHEKEKEALLARLDRLAAEAAPAADHAPVRRAMDNLKAALRNRMARGGLAGDAVLDVAALIDEAASRIERLK